MRCKRFWNKQCLGALLHQISDLPSHQGGHEYPSAHLTQPHLFHDRERKICNFIDGLVFTLSDARYIDSEASRPQLLKWKYLSKNTIDFLVAPATTEETKTLGHGTLPSDRIAVALRCRVPAFTTDTHNAQSVASDSGAWCGGWREVTFRTTPVPIEYWNRVVKPHMATGSGGGRVIVECAFNRYNGLWELLKVRADKDAPNFFSTVMSTIEALVEHITLDDLLSACINPHNLLPMKGSSTQSPSLTSRAPHDPKPIA
jgi:hypothetical protein